MALIIMIRMAMVKVMIEKYQYGLSIENKMPVMISKIRTETARV